MKNFLHVGCGAKRKHQTTPEFNRPEWKEVRLDIDPKASPDILGTMTNLGEVLDGEFDASKQRDTHFVHPLVAHRPQGGGTSGSPAPCTATCGVLFLDGLI